MMDLFKKIALSVLLVTALSACGGGGGGTTNVPTDTSLVFNLFPPDYFGGLYLSSFSLTGSYSDGTDVTSTFNQQSGSVTAFNSQPVNTIDTLATLTITSTGAVIPSPAETYYSTDINNLLREGGYTGIDNVSMTATSVSVIPLTATIGNFGNVGSYTHSDGKTSTISWILQDGFNGKAKITTIVIVMESGALYATSTNSFTISQDGTRSNIDVSVVLHTLGLTLTMSGPQNH